MHGWWRGMARLLPAGLLAGLAAGLLAGCGGAPKQPDILLVVLDTVRQDAAGPDCADPNWRDHTPNLNRLAAEGTVFSNAWAPAPWTVPSHASLFTGLLPSEHGCSWSNTRLDPAQPTLAEWMGRGGYATAAFYSNPWLADRTTGLLRGFSVRDEAPIGGLNNLTSPLGDQGGRRILQSAASWLGKQGGGRPFFAFVNILEAHLPFDPPAEVRKIFLADLPPTAIVPIQLGHEYNAGLLDGAMVDWNRVRRIYGGDVYTADSLLGDLIQVLKQRNLYDRTVLIVTSDHGENLGDHGLMDHQFSVHETLLRVPLVIRDPTRQLARGRRDDPVLLTDLFSTVLDLGRVPDAPPRSHGRSLLGLPDKQAHLRPLYAEYDAPRDGLLRLMLQLNPGADLARLGRSYKTVRVGDLRLTVASDGTEVLHDLAADRTQAVDIAARRPQAVAQLRALLAHLKPAPGGSPDSQAPLDSNTIRQLESLGYIH